jgi:Chaperone of endosialidase
VNYFYTLSLFIILISTQALAVPTIINFQANIRKPDGSRLEAPDVSFRFKYLNDSGSCTIYTEDFVNQSMVGSGGNISLKMGDGAKVFPPSATTLDQTFSNATTNVMDCAEGSTYTPSLSTEKRNLRVEFTYAGSGGLQVINGIEVNTVPYALYANDAEKLGGEMAALFVKFSNFTSCSNGDFLTYRAPSFFCETPVGASQWTTNAANIYFNTGNVGIGVTTPMSNFHVLSAGGPATGVLVESSAPTAYSSLDLKNSTGDLLQLSMTGSTYAGVIGARSGNIGSSGSGGLNIAAYDAAGVLRFATGGMALVNERMRIDQLGRVGIGTTTPTASLQLKAGTATAGTSPLKLTSGVNLTTPEAGAVEYDGTNLYYTDGTATRKTLASVGGTGNISGLTAGRVPFAGSSTSLTDSANLFWDSTNSRLGLGTTTPAEKLEVNGNLKFTSGAYLDSTTVIGAGQNDLTLYAPDYLHINTGYGDVTMNRGLSLNGNIGLGGRGKKVVYGGGEDYMWVNNSTNNMEISSWGSIILGPNSGGTITPLMTLASGNVGIGTTSPASALEVSGAIRVGNFVRPDNGLYAGSDSSNSPNLSYVSLLLGYTPQPTSGMPYANAIRLAGDVTGGKASVFEFAGSDYGGHVPKTAIAFDPAGNSFYRADIKFVLNSSDDRNSYNLSDTKMTIKSGSGNVGIGITNPGYKLDVDGDINIAATSSLMFAGTPICNSGGCVSPSDLRLKENIKPLHNSLSKILRLEGVEYDYKDKVKFGNIHQVGVIAQDVEKVFPEVVITNEKTGFKAVAYDHLVAPIIESIKALYNLLGVHDREIASVKAENAQLKKQNADIKAYLCAKDPNAPICE